MNENQFTFGRPVKNHEFFNRKKETEKAFEFIRKLENLSIIGENCIGRTSFLIHILSRETFLEYGVDYDKYVIVHLEMDSLSIETKEMLLEEIIRNIERQTEINIESADVFTKLKALIGVLTSEEKNLIIAIDEFEIIAPLLDNRLSSWLRHVFQLENVMAIAVSRRTLREFESGGFASPLHNIFGKLRLGLFSREDTENMIKEVFGRGGAEPQEEEIALLADISGGNPYLIQFFGSHYRRRISSDNFKNEMFEQARDLFEGYWENLNEEEKEFFSNTKTSTHSWIGHNLEERGFLIREENRWRIISFLIRKKEWRVFSPLFCTFLEAKISETCRELRERNAERDNEIRKPRNKRHAVLKIAGALIIGIFANLVAILIQEKVESYSGLINGITIDSNQIVRIIFILVFLSVVFLIPSFFLRKRNFRFLSRNRVLFCILSILMIVLMYYIFRLIGISWR